MILLQLSVIRLNGLFILGNIYRKWNIRRFAEKSLISGHLSDLLNLFEYLKHSE